MLKLTREVLRRICISNEWFTCGTNEQYEKLFAALDNERPLHEIATIIWVCSEDCWTLDGIKAMLRTYETECLKNKNGLPDTYAEIEYPDMESAEAIDGARFDDLNYQHYTER